MTSWFCDQFLQNSIFYRDQFYVTRDHFEKDDDQNWSQNQLVRLIMGWLRSDWSQKPLKKSGFLDDSILGYE
jgi:hypothetical protein